MSSDRTGSPGADGAQGPHEADGAQGSPGPAGDSNLFTDLFDGSGVQMTATTRDSTVLGPLCVSTVVGAVSATPASVACWFGTGTRRATATTALGFVFPDPSTDFPLTIGQNRFAERSRPRAAKAETEAWSGGSCLEQGLRSTSESLLAHQRALISRSEIKNNRLLFSLIAQFKSIVKVRSDDRIMVDAMKLY